MREMSSVLETMWPKNNNNILVGKRIKGEACFYTVCMQNDFLDREADKFTNEYSFVKSIKNVVSQPAYRIKIL